MLGFPRGCLPAAHVPGDLCILHSTPRQRLPGVCVSSRRLFFFLFDNTQQALSFFPICSCVFCSASMLKIKLFGGPGFAGVLVPLSSSLCLKGNLSPSPSPGIAVIQELTPILSAPTAAAVSVQAHFQFSVCFWDFPCCFCVQPY